MIPIKSGREIEKMRQACRTASDILERVSDSSALGSRPKKLIRRPRISCRRPA